MTIKCPYCSQVIVPDNLCKHIKVIEFDDNGNIKSLQFGPEEFTMPIYMPIPYYQPYPVYPSYPYRTWIVYSSSNPIGGNISGSYTYNQEVYPTVT